MSDQSETATHRTDILHVLIGIGILLFSNVLIVSMIAEEIGVALQQGLALIPAIGFMFVALPFARSVSEYFQSKMKATRGDIRD